MSQSNLPAHIHITRRHPVWRNLDYPITNEYHNANIALSIPKWISEESKKIVFLKFEKVAHKVTEFSEK